MFALLFGLTLVRSEDASSRGCKGSEGARERNAMGCNFFRLRRGVCVGVPPSLYLV